MYPRMVTDCITSTILSQPKHYLIQSHHLNIPKLEATKSLNLLENVIGQYDLITENNQNITCFKGMSKAYFYLDNIFRGFKCS